MPHRLTVAGHTLYAWCAFDTLFLPELFGATAEVESQCPTTDERITLTVTGTELTNVRPEATVLSYLDTDEPLDQHVINTFWHFIHFFANPAAADEWTAQRDGAFAIPVADGREIARLVNRGRYPSIVTH
jgi:alkylmercury lyase